MIIDANTSMSLLIKVFNTNKNKLMSSRLTAAEIFLPDLSHIINQLENAGPNLQTV